MFPLTDAQVDEIARVAHEANRGYCLFLGDDSQKPWAEAPAWQKDSIRAGVRAIVLDPTITPAESHRRWMGRKMAEGWVYGPTKDTEAKTHPAIVSSFERLPKTMKAKDHIFVAIVRALLAPIPLGKG